MKEKIERNCHSTTKIGLGKDQYKMSLVTRLYRVYSIYMLAAHSFSFPKKAHIIHHNAQISVGFLLLVLLPPLLLLIVLLLSILLGFLFTNHRFSQYCSPIQMSPFHTYTYLSHVCMYSVCFFFCSSITLSPDCVCDKLQIVKSHISIVNSNTQPMDQRVSWKKKNTSKRHFDGRKKKKQHSSIDNV